MKKKLLIMCILLLVYNLKAQVKTTGTVGLLSNMSAKLDLDNSNSSATLTFTGPSDRWYALQFGDFTTGQGMEEGQDVVYFNGSVLVDAVHNGIGIQPSADTNHWTMVSNTVDSGIRTVIATRAFNTGDPNDYIFNYSNSSIDFAYSRSNSASFNLAYHGASNRGYRINRSFTVLGIEDLTLVDKSISLIPNPTKENFKISSDFDHQFKTINIYNTIGKKVLFIENPDSRTVNVSQLQSGVYYVEFVSSSNEHIETKKLIINQL